MGEYDGEYFEGIKQGPYSGYDTPFKRATLDRYTKKIDGFYRVRGGDRVLDIGCAYGLFLKILDARGANTYGMDVSAHAVDRARMKTAAELMVADANEPLPFPDSFFRMVTAFDVVEHLASPSRTLSEILRVLEPEGLLALTTINGRAASRYLKPSYWMADKDPSHLYLFDRLTLRFLLERAGFEVLGLTTPFHRLSGRVSRVLEGTGLGGQIFAIASPRADNH